MLRIQGVAMGSVLKAVVPSSSPGPPASSHKAPFTSRGHSHNPPPQPGGISGGSVEGFSRIRCERFG
ncbi:hypothetical protein XELAEV_18003214mg [Xenopus laevis]|nr:hypothetical protein XELAEV_18003214mg [Xenopus laevis]